MKIVKIVGIIMLGIIIIGLVILMLSKSTVRPSNVFVKDVDASDNKVTLKGTFMDSAIKYKGYTAEYKNEELYIKIKGGLISFSKTKEINISIANSYGKIKGVYLQDDTPSGNILIWPK